MAESDDGAAPFFRTVDRDRSRAHRQRRRHPHTHVKNAVAQQIGGLTEGLDIAPSRLSLRHKLATALSLDRVGIDALERDSREHRI